MVTKGFLLGNLAQACLHIDWPMSRSKCAPILAELSIHSWLNGLQSYHLSNVYPSAGEREHAVWHFGRRWRDRVA
eukprot:6209315-Pleurochrysis_carterae.AAC.2